MPMKPLIQLFIPLLFSTYMLNAQTSDALTFDGNNDFVEIPTNALNNIGTNNFTFEAWINGEESLQNSHPTIFSNRNASSNGMDFFFHNLWGTSQYKMLCVQLGGTNYILLNNGSFNGSILDGNCHHVAISRSESIITFYVDGLSLGTRTIMPSGGIPTTTSTESLKIGIDIPTNNVFNGTISQVRIWDIARSSSAIGTDMNLSILGSTPNLVGYWELNEGTGQVITDKTNNSNGTIGSSTSVDSNDPTWTSENSCNLALSATEFKNSPLEISIYPNPSTHYVNLVFNSKQSDVKYSIVAINGKIVISDMVSNTSEFQIDLQSLAKGVYFAEIKTASHKIIKKIVKL